MMISYLQGLKLFLTLNTGMFGEILDLFVSACKIGGGLWLFIGGFIFASALKDKNGPDIQRGIWQMVGGALILTMAVMLPNVIA